MYEFEKMKLKHHLNSIYDELKNYKCFVAGGMITSLFCNREIADVDIYFRNKQDVADFIRECINGSSHWIVSKTEKALLIKYNSDLLIQLIYFDTFNSVDEIFNTFDFTVCMGAYDCEKEEFKFHEDFFKHNAQRILKFNQKTAYPLMSAFRVQKYEDKGYKISKDELMRVLLTCTTLNINTYEEFKEQVGGMYGLNYDEELKPKDGEEFNLINTIEKMSTLCLNENYLKNINNSFTNFNIDELIFEVLGEKCKYYVVNGDKYVRYYDSIERLYDIKDEEMYIEGDVFKDLLKGNRLYKYVNKVDGKYYSFYDNNFEYKLGEEIIPKKSTYYYGNDGIHCGLYNDRDNFTYSDKKTKVLIELEIDKSSDIKEISHDSFILNRCKFVREITDESNDFSILEF